MISFTIREASLILGVKVRTIRNWISEGRIKAYKEAEFGKGHYWRIAEDEIERLKKEISEK